MAETMQHVTVLADEIGPRPATSEAESQAASYLESVFIARGLEPEIQEFDAPRSYSWAFVVYHLLSIGAVAATWPNLLPWPMLWPMFGVSALVAFVMWVDLDRRWGLMRLLPKGPSQNIIARHIPKARRGERLKKVVIVAHYDSARASLAFSPALARHYGLTSGLTKFTTFAIPVVLLADGLPLPVVPPVVHTYLWWTAVGLAAYLLIPLFINVHRELAMPYVDGANDNASGVAAMLGVLHNLVSEPDANRFATSQFTPVRRGPEAAAEAGVAPEGSLLEYTPASGRGAGTALPDDFEWAEPEEQLTRAPSRGQGSFLEFDTMDFGVVEERPRRRDDSPIDSAAPVSSAAPTAPAPPERAMPSMPPAAPVRAPIERPAHERITYERRQPSMSAAPASDLREDEPLPGAGTGEIPMVSEPMPMPRREKPKREGGLFGGFGKRRKQTEDEDVAGWLGVDEEFNAREAGKEIGSWDKFGDDDDAGGLGWKGGWAADDPIGDDDFAAVEAARIRRRVTEGMDRDLVEKEVWFVATGSEEVGTVGMEAFLDAYGEDIRDALIINIDNVGAGQLSWVTREGMARRYRSNQRLIGLAKRVSREQEIIVKPRVYKGLSTDATPALARGFKAVTLMGFDSSGVPANWHWKTDTSAEVDPEAIDRVTELVTNMIRQA